jgi:hypothetical protein
VSLIVTVLGALLVWQQSQFFAPGNQQGYEPVQPINFSHKIHSGTNQIPCQYCHSLAEKSQVAGIPTASTCMNCHSKVIKDSSEVRKIAAALQSNQPIRWIRIHQLPSFATFDHSRHVNSGITCQTCHGSVETMDRVSQATDFTMGFCVNCHRSHQNVMMPDTGIMKGTHIVPVKLDASTDCSVCHH